MQKTPKYPVEKRGPSYQRYLAKLRRRSKWKSRARRPKREKAAPVIVVEKKTKRILVKKPVTDQVMARRLGVSVRKVKELKKPFEPGYPFLESRRQKPVVPRASMKDVIEIRRKLHITTREAKRLASEISRTEQSKYKPKKKKKIWLPKTIQKAMR